MTSPADNTVIASRPTTKPSIIKYLLLLILVFLLIVGATGGVVLGAAYAPQTFSFVPTKVRLATNQVLTKLPVPRNLEQIFITSFEKSAEMKSFAQTMYIQLNMRNDSSADNQSYAVRIDGKNDLSETDNPKSSNTISLLVDSEFGTLQSSADLLTIDKSLYFRVNDISTTFTDDLSELGLNIDDYVGTWFSMSTDYAGETVSGLSGMLVANSDTTDLAPDIDLGSLPAEFFTYMLDHNYYDYFSLADDEVVNGYSTHHIALDKSGSELKSFASYLIDFFVAKLDQAYPDYKISETFNDDDKQQLLDDLKDVQRLMLDVWIDSSTNQIIRATSNIELVSTYTNGLDTTETSFTSISLGIEFSEINLPQNITAPEGATPLEDFITQMYQTSYDQANDSAAISNVSAVATAVESYYTLNYGVYPNDLNALEEEGFLSAGYFDYLDSTYNEPIVYLTDGENCAIITKLSSSAKSDTPYYAYDSETGLPGYITETQYQSYLQNYNATDTLNKSTLGVMDIVNGLLPIR